MADGKVLYAFQDDVYILKFVGDVRFTICTAVDQFIQKIFSEDKVFPVLIDLLDTESVDSTALGVLAQVAVKMRDSFQQKPTIITTGEDINTILQSVCFDQVFNIVCQDAGSKTDAYTELQPIETNEKEFAQQVLRAHEHLMSISPTNEEKFKDVASTIKLSD